MGNRYAGMRGLTGTALAVLPVLSGLGYVNAQGEFNHRDFILDLGDVHRVRGLGGRGRGRRRGEKGLVSNGRSSFVPILAVPGRGDTSGCSGDVLNPGRDYSRKHRGYV